MYATSFFYLVDQLSFVDKLIVPSSFESFDLRVLEDLALDYVNEVDYIIFTSDVNFSRFPKSKIIGNVDTGAINDKFKLYKKLYKNFLLPETYLLNDFNEALEVVNNSDKSFLVKPRFGSGGVGIDWFNKDSIINNDFILQEYVSGSSISSSFLAYPGSDITMLCVSDQVIGSKRLGASNFMYCGNVTPFIRDVPKVHNISSKIARMCRLRGVNGIDFVLQGDRVYVLEVNPRICGTFENIETSFDINLAKAHIDSCNNDYFNLPSLRNFSVKLIPYSFIDSAYTLSSTDNVHDISSMDYVIKKGSPIATIITSDRILENAMSKAQRLQKIIYNSKK